MNDVHIYTYNPIFKALQELYTREQHTYNIKDKLSPA
jgi:hypothetical protein